jgi:hypothetical protein
MARYRGAAAIWASMVSLCGQTIISIMLFGHRHQDGGAWPIILFIFLTLDLSYAAYMVRLVERGTAPAWLVTTSTVFLSVALVGHSNFSLIFGEDPRRWSRHVDLLHLFLSAPIFPYGIYLVAAFGTKFLAEWHK